MAHFALLDSNNIVTRVTIVNNNDCLDADGNEREEVGLAYLMKLHGGTWKQASYNGNIRKNYPGIGFTYDASRDAFIPPKPYQAWTLNDSTCLWDPPVAYPSDSNLYSWDSDASNWAQITE